jgi:hypothetical protein
MHGRRSAAELPVTRSINSGLATFAYSRRANSSQTPEGSSAHHADRQDVRSRPASDTTGSEHSEHGQRVTASAIPQTPAMTMENRR